MLARPEHITPLEQRSLDAIRDLPGIHYRELARRIGVAQRSGQLRYALDQLIRLSLIVEVADGGFRCYFANGAVDRAERASFTAWHRPSCRAVLLQLLHGPMMHGDLRRNLNLAEGSLQHALGYLTASGIVSQTQTGRSNLVALSVEHADAVRKAAKTLPPSKLAPTAEAT